MSKTLVQVTSLTSTAAIEARIAELEANTRQAVEQLKAELERAKINLARGTDNDLTEKALEAQAMAAVKDPKFPFFIGDDTSSDVLQATVRRAITVRPRTLQELVEITGARRNRVSSELYKMQLRYPNRMKNHGNKYRALWHFPKQRKTGEIPVVSG